MALRSQIGSSLVAKANPASPIRKTEEMKVLNPAIPGKGATGSLNRQFVEQPFLRPIPEGSARTVSVNPSAEAGSIASPTNQIPTEAGGQMGMIPPAGGQPQLRSGSDNQALFQGGVSPTAASAPARAGVTARASSLEGVNKGAINPSGQILSDGASTEASGEGFRTASTQLPLVKELGGGVIAGEEGKGFQGVTGTALQQVAGTLGKALTSLGTKINAPQLKSGGLGAALQTFGGSSAVAKQGIGSAGNALRSVVQTVNKALSKLRSLFK